MANSYNEVSLNFVLLNETFKLPDCVIVVQPVIKVMLRETICNDNFLPHTALQCWKNVATIRNNFATMLYSDAVLR